MSDKNHALPTEVPRDAPIGPGSRLGRYEILAPLQAGGMASLFLGRRIGPAGFARPVAIKVVHPHLAGDSTIVEMFLEEARLAARIQHPNVVNTEELGQERGTYYLAMEYIRGCSLAQFLERLSEEKQLLSHDIAAHIVMKVADGLHAAHEAKDESGLALSVVHRDISPQNILLSYDGQVKLIDFGVAKAAGRSRETAAGFLKGKLGYMSPEQAWGYAIDRRTDIYALGIVLWECLTQRALFDAEDDAATLAAVRTPFVRLPSALADGVSLGLDRAVLTALAPSPDGRFQTAQEFRRAIALGAPNASLVEPEELAALLATTMARDIAEDEERTRSSRPPAAIDAGASAASGAASVARGSFGSDSVQPASHLRSTDTLPTSWPWVLRTSAMFAAAVGVALVSAAAAWGISRGSAVAEVPPLAPTTAIELASPHAATTIVGAAAPTVIDQSGIGASTVEASTAEAEVPAVTPLAAPSAPVRHARAHPMDTPPTEPIDAWAPTAERAQPPSLLFVPSVAPREPAP